MTDWQAVTTNDYAVPDDLDAAVGELTGMLAARDPVVRDERAYSTLARWIDRGVLDDRLVTLGDEMATWFLHPEIQARTFAPLIIDCAVERDTATGVVGAAPMRRWWDAFAAWWPAETDTHGWDADRGWLHAVAHGSDVVGAYGESPRSGAPELTAVLDAVAARIVAPSDYLYRHMEQDRVARAASAVLARPELPAAAVTDWLDPVRRMFAAGEPGPLAVNVNNTVAVLRAGYVMLDRTPGPHREPALAAIAELLHEYYPGYPA